MIEYARTSSWLDELGILVLLAYFILLLTRDLTINEFWVTTIAIIGLLTVIAGHTLNKGLQILTTNEN